MPVVMVFNCNEALRDHITTALVAQFPKMIGDICINLILEPTGDRTPFANVYSSNDEDMAVIASIRQLCGNLLEIRPKQAYGFEIPGAIYYGEADDMEVRTNLWFSLGVPTKWIRSDPRLLNGEKAPYVELHAGDNQELAGFMREEVKGIVDAEIYCLNYMEFYPKDE